MWKRVEPILSDETYQKIDAFFENRRENEKMEYREGQHTMALDIVEAINEKQFLLIEAGVGSGKSWGYLVPVIYASKESKDFKGFIISTSSIALEEQLKKEIESLSNLLQVDIPVVIAKGKNNYICQKRLENYIHQVRNPKDLLHLREQLLQGKVEHSDFDTAIPDRIWENIRVDRANCKRCLHQENCGYKLNRKKCATSKAVITNHNLLLQSLMRDSDDKIFDRPSVLIVDEAHTLPDKVIDTFTQVLNKKQIENVLIRAQGVLSNEGFDYHQENPVIDTLNIIYHKIRGQAGRDLKKQTDLSLSQLESGRSGFACNDTIKIETRLFLRQLKQLEKSLNEVSQTDKTVRSYCDSLKMYRNVFHDLIQDEKNRKNVYFVRSIPKKGEYIDIYYVPKDLTKQSACLFSNPNYAKVFTSATLTTEKNNYSYFEQSMGFDKLSGIFNREDSQPSPYDYANHALLYYPVDAINPKTKDKEAYLEDMTDKIDALLHTTNGHSLILFTAKSDMKKVKEKLEKRKDETTTYQIYSQEDGVDNEALKEKFQQDESSVLLATGAFWEGIDVKGSSLENLIITKLPFPVVDPIMENKATQTRPGIHDVYFYDMLTKLRQGTGRLIRTNQDKGVVAILDARFKDYKDDILDVLPFEEGVNVTTDMQDVKRFTKQVLKR